MRTTRRHPLDGKTHSVAECLRGWRTSTTEGRLLRSPPQRNATTARLVARVRPDLSRRS
jgi:hypothetical protein